MRLLAKLGFIKTKPHASEELGYVVILNPYKVVRKLHEDTGRVDEGWYFALEERADEIKATDLNDS